MNPKHHLTVAPSGAAVWLMAGGIALALLIARADSLGCEPPALPAVCRVEPEGAAGADEPVREPDEREAGSAAAASLLPGPSLRVEQVLQDWGEVEAGQAVRCTFRLHNDGDAPVLLARSRRQRSDLQVRFQPEIPPGGTGLVEVELATGRLAPGLAQVACELAANTPVAPRLLLRGAVRERP